MAFCRRRQSAAVDQIVVERLRKLEGIAQPVVPPKILDAQDVSLLVSP